MLNKNHNNNVYGNLVNGNWVMSKSEQTFDILSPVDGSIVGKIPFMTKEEIDDTINHAKVAQKSWKDTPVSDRAKILSKAADILEENIEYLSGILEIEIAKDTDSAISEIRRTADFIRFTANEGMHIQGETIGADNFPGYKKNKISFVSRVPLGIVLAISPFNYPICIFRCKIFRYGYTRHSIQYRSHEQAKSNCTQF